MHPKGNHPSQFQLIRVGCLGGIRIKLTHKQTHTHKHTLTVNHASKIRKSFTNIQKIINVYLGTLALNKGILKLGILRKNIIFKTFKGRTRHLNLIHFERLLGLVHVIFQILLKPYILIFEKNTNIYI